MKRTPPLGRVVIVHSRLLTCLILLWCPCAFAVNPTWNVKQYAHTAWKIRDGFTKGEIFPIAQTPNGYLWLGTEFGLQRFDGVKNIEWQPPVGQSLPSNWIFSLLAARDGTLWIGTTAGLASWKDGKLTQYPELAERYIFAIVEDHEGTIWASGVSVSLGKLCAIRGSKTQCYGEGVLGRGAFNLYVDSKSNVWAGVKDGLWRWNPGPPKFYPLPGEPDGIQAISENNEGTLLVGWHGGIYRFDDGKTEAYPLPHFAQPFRAKRILPDPNGGLWISTNIQGLIHVHDGVTDLFTESDGLSSNAVYNFLLDHEGNIWVATSNGLDRFRNLAVAMLPGKDFSGAGTLVGSVLADKRGGLWLSTGTGLMHWDNGQIKTYDLGRQKNGSKLNDHATAIFQDDGGRVWAGTLNGIGYVEGDRFIRLKDLQGGVVISFAQDRAGNLWLDNEEKGLFRLSKEGALLSIPWADLGHKDHASVIEADPSDSGLWIGFFLGGIAYYTNGQIRSSYTTANGLGKGRVRGIEFDRDGSLWISTEGGLSRLKNGRIATLTSKNGLPCDTVNWAKEDDDHALWLYTACGLVRVTRPALDVWTAAADQGYDSNTKIQVTVFDNSDGVRSLVDSGHYNPQVAKTTDGKLWFLPPDGVSVLDGRHLRLNRLPPPVHIEQVIADRKSYEVTPDLNGRLYVPALSRDLQIDYTALSLVAPEKIRFRYKLDGYDRDWQDAGSRRQAFYTNLRPGNYTFHVIACNNDGVWNETGAAMSLIIPPAFYQTYWFLALCVITLGLVIWLLYIARVRQLATIYKGRTEERVHERERIARDLHDTFLQSVQGLILKFDAAAKQIPQDQPARKAMESALDRADEVMAEGRERVRNLRDTTVSLGNLPEAFARVAQETAQDGDVTFKTVVEGRVRNLSQLVLEESYAIGREAIINALTHSEGRHIEAELTYDRRQFRLRVRDDGRGIDKEILDAGGRTDHYGLGGMRERARRIEGQLNLWSGVDRGTEVELVVPAKTAYHIPSNKAK